MQEFLETSLVWSVCIQRCRTLQQAAISKGQQEVVVGWRPDRAHLQYMRLAEQQRLPSGKPRICY